MWQNALQQTQSLKIHSNVRIKQASKEKVKLKTIEE